MQCMPAYRCASFSCSTRTDIIIWHYNYNGMILIVEVDALML